MVMVPTSRRAFVRKHFSPHLDHTRFALEESDLSKLAGPLDCCLTEQKEYLEWAIALLAAEVWFDSVAPDPREFGERLSLVGDHAFKLASELAPQVVQT